MSAGLTPSGYDKLREWLAREVLKGKKARLDLRMPLGTAQQNFLLERAVKAESTARVLRKVLKTLASE